MGSFGARAAMRVRKRDARASAGVARGGRHQLAERFEGVGEALSRGGEGLVACAVVGRRMAREGVDLGEALEGLRTTTVHVTGREPSYDAVRALGTAWAEEALGYVHQLSCEDALTGLAGPAHLRSRLTEVYRGAEQRGEAVSETHAIVVVSVPAAAGGGLSGSLAVVRLAERIRLIFAGEETLCQVPGRGAEARALVLVRRTPDLGRSVTNLHGLVEVLGTAAAPARVWIEGLPASVQSAVPLLDELARRA